MAEPARRSVAARVGIAAVVAVIYLVAGKLGLMLAVVHPNATAVWAPSGIALAAFLRLGYGVWPAIFVAAFLVNVTTAGSIATSIGIALGNTLEGLVGSYLVRRFAGGLAVFERPSDVVRFTGVAALISTMVSATIGVSTLALAGYAGWDSYPSIWLTWWLGDAAGALVVAPPLLLWSADARVRWSGRRWIEGAAALVALVIVGVIIFGGWIPLAFLCLPIMVWVAFRLGPREAAAATLVLSGIALWGTVHGLGPFPRTTPAGPLLALQAFMGTLAVTTLVLAAAVFAQRRAEEARRAEAVERIRAYESLEKSEHLHRAIAELTSDFAVILRVEPEGTLVVESATEGFTRVTGYTLEELAAGGNWRSLVHEDTALVLEGATKLLLSGERVSLELRVIPRSGEPRWLSCHGRPFWDASHTRVIRILGAAEDVTERLETEAALRRQQDVIRELSTPVLRIRERLLIIPVIGQIDALRAEQLTDQLLASIRSNRAKVVVIDMTGVAAMPPNVAQHLLRTAQACRLLGASIIITGLSRMLADTLVTAGGGLGRIATLGDLQSGIEEAERFLKSEPRAVATAPPARAVGTARADLTRRRGR